MRVALSNTRYLLILVALAVTVAVQPHAARADELNYPDTDPCVWGDPEIWGGRLLGLEWQ